MAVILSLLFFIVGLFLRPVISKWIKKYFLVKNTKRFEVVFRIEFYSQPSIHHVGEEGTLVKSEPIKVQVDALDADEALSILDGVVKQEVKSELVSIKEIPKL